MTATINTCLAQLKSDMQSAWVTGSGGDGSVDAIYDYRTFPDKLNKVVSLSYQGGMPAEKTTGGESAHYEITAVVGSQMIPDSDGVIGETEQRTAEQALNTIENNLYTLLGKGGTANRNNYWMTIVFDAPSIHPPSFVETPTTRYAEIPFRLILK